MDRIIARRYAPIPFVSLYGEDAHQAEMYFDYCRAVREGAEADEYTERHLAHLVLYEQAEQGDFSHWLTSSDSIRRLAAFAARNDRCDVIEKYAPQLPSSPHWNGYISIHYNHSLYPVLSLVMPLPVTSFDAMCYVRWGLHREVMVHIVGRADRATGKTITLEGIGLMVVIFADPSCPRPLLGLEEIGLDLGNPQLLATALEDHKNGAVVDLLRQRAERGN